MTESPQNWNGMEVYDTNFPVVDDIIRYAITRTMLDVGNAILQRIEENEATTEYWMEWDEFKLHMESI